MRSRCLVGVLVLAALMSARVDPAQAAEPRRRKPLDPREREAVLALLKAVDLAQDVDAASDATVEWDSHILKAGDQTAYVPFRLVMHGAGNGFASTAMYVRVVSRRDGWRVAEERSSIREWVLRGGGPAPRRAESIPVGLGEMPVGGLAVSSSRQAVSAPASASAALALQQRAFEKDKAADEEARRKLETKERDPFLFPFEDYFFVDLKSPRAGDPRVIERALALPPGEYDVFIGLVDRARVKTSSPVIVKRTVTVPDFWNDRLALSSLILVSDVRALMAPLTASQQAEHPYALGRTEIVPVVTASFAPSEAISVVFQMCNYGAPDADLTAEYTFYRTDGTRRLFNRTEPQQYADADLPPPGGWSTQAFGMQTVPLQPFPPGLYELEVEVRDRVTRATAKATVAFTVASGLR